MKSKCLLGFLFVFYCFQAVASFPEIEPFLEGVSVQEKSRIISRIDEEHKDLSSIQKNLSLGLSQSFSMISPPTPTHGASSVSSSSRAKSVVESWEDANFALATLLIVLNDGKILPFKLYPGFTNENPTTSFARVYDSCFDRTHNFIPSLDGCEEQWHRYLEKSAPIFGQDTQDVKDSITRLIDNIRTNINGIKEEPDPESVITTTKLVVDDIQTYHSFLQTWIHTGWHSEQRILYDLDQDYTLTPLENVKKTSGIRMIIGCLHTKFSPCKSPPKPSTCDCLQCLKNWPTRWRFSQQNTEIPVFMTVSYESLFKSVDRDYNRYLSSTDKFFVKSTIPNDISVVGSQAVQNAKSWAVQGLLKKQLNDFRQNEEVPFNSRFRREILPIGYHETELFGAIKPLLAESGVEVAYESSPDLVECRFLNLSTPTLQIKRHYSEETQVHNLVVTSQSDVGIVESMAPEVVLKLSENPERFITLYASSKAKKDKKASADTDWTLLVKFLSMRQLKKA
jgi:hypothetical protein